MRKNCQFDPNGQSWLWSWKRPQKEHIPLKYSQLLILLLFRRRPWLEWFCTFQHASGNTLEYLQLPHSAGLPGPGIRIIIMWRDKMMKEVVQIEGGWCSGAPYPTKGAWDLRSVFVTADWVLIWRLHSTTGVKQSSGRDNNMGDDFGFVQARRSIYFKNVCRGSSSNRRSRHTKR